MWCPIGEVEDGDEDGDEDEDEDEDEDDEDEDGAGGREFACARTDVLGTSGF